MAKIINGFKFRGTIDGITYRQTQYGTIASKKSNLDAKRIATDPSYERTRETNNAFKKAVHSATALGRILKNYDIRKEAHAHGKLVKKFLQIIKFEKTDRTDLSIEYEGLCLLRNHEFNTEPYRGQIPKVAVDYRKRTTKISFNQFNPAFYRLYSYDSFRLVVLHIEFDIDREVSVPTCIRTEVMHSGGEEAPHSLFWNIEHQSPEKGAPIIVGIGIEPGFHINGKFYPSGSKDQYPFKIVAVEG